MIVPLGRFPDASSDSMPGASPDASDQAPDSVPPLSFFFPDGSAVTAESFSVVTIDHPPTEADAAAGAAVDAAGATVSAGGIGAAAGVQTSSLGAGTGVGD